MFEAGLSSRFSWCSTRHSTASGEPCPGNPRRIRISARADRVRSPARWYMKAVPACRAGPRRHGEAHARGRHRRGCAPHGRGGPARPIDAYRRINSSGRPRPANLCRSVRPARQIEAQVTATGARTKSPYRGARPHRPFVELAQQKTVLRVVRNLAAFNGFVIAMLVACLPLLEDPAVEIIPLVLTAVLASIPVALPATLALASALGARALAKLVESFQPHSQQWMKRRRWRLCAR